MPGSTDRPLSPLHPRETKVAEDCLRVLTYSGWNPPPSNRKMHGDLLYLYVVTNEGKPYHITSSTRGFFINKFVMLLPLFLSVFYLFLSIFLYFFLSIFLYFYLSLFLSFFLPFFLYFFLYFFLSLFLSFFLSYILFFISNFYYHHHRSTQDVYDSKPASPVLLCHSLIEILSQISVSFKKNFTSLLKKRLFIFCF